MRKQQVNILSTLVVTFGLAGVTHGADLYVSKDGLDTNTGSKSQPLASLSVAREKARSSVGKEALTVHVADGIYYLPETLIFTADDSGTEALPVVYKAENEGGAVLSGGSVLKLSWQAHQDGIFKAQTPKGLSIDQLFIDGRNQRMARYPNYDPALKAKPYQGYAADAFSKERAANWSDPKGGYIHAMHRGSWGGYHYQITGKDENGEVTYEGGWQNNRQMGMHKEFRMVENIFEELDAEGEWFHDAQGNTLYYQPAEGVDLKTAKVEVVRLRHLIEFKGSEEKPVKHLTLQGFVVRHAARTFMDCKEPLLRSDWAIYRGGAFMLTGTEHVQVLDTEFDQVGGNAIFVNNYNRNMLIKGCHIHDTGASGVCFVGDPKAVHDPLFEYGQKNDLSKIDRTVGPKSNNYPAQSAVEDCLIHGIGRVERQPAGVQISMAQEIAVRDTSIYDTARAGINISEGTWGGHLIERCDVFDTVLETHDHGSFNSWGRDRYWRGDHLTASQKAVDAEPDLPFLDAMKTTVIRDSRWRCEHGWDVDLDDGTSNYDLYNNLMLSGGLKLREGFRRKAWNNVIVNNGLSSHVWFQNSNDQVTGNIMARANAPYIQKEVTVEGLVDKNFYYQANEAQLKRNHEEFGWDENSLVGDPLFVDPENGDFSVKEGSPAFAIGFKNFPMDQFGVKKPSLKAIALTPSFMSKHRKKAIAAKKEVKPLVEVWQGASVNALKGNEFSAYGVTQEEGGVAVRAVQPISAAARAGLKEGDLIQAVNSQAVSQTEDLYKQLAAVKNGAVKLKVVRNQQAIALSLEIDTAVVVESVSTSSQFKQLPLPPASDYKVTANQKTSNDPLATLTDGQLNKSFGPVFGNGINNGAYKMDLGEVRPLRAITSWSCQMGSSRGQQKLTLYGSDAATDPGWDLSKFTPFGTIMTGKVPETFTATSLRAVEGKELGSYRWIIWMVSPVSDLGGAENTSFQEFSVEIVGSAKGTSTKGEPTTSASASAEQQAHLFILSGQSNMVGLDPSVSFTPALKEAFEPNQFIVVKDAQNSQSIRRWYKEWKSVQGKPFKNSGDLYDRLLENVKKAVAGRPLETVTFIWMQGEADASQNQVGVYEASLDGLINQLRKDLKRDDIHFVIGRLSDYSLDSGKHPEWQKMRDLQKAYAEADPLREWVNTDDLNNKTDKAGKPKNDVHYTREGYKILGQRLAEKAIGLIQSKSEGPLSGPPQFSGERSNFRGYDRYDRIKSNGGHFSVVCPKNPTPGKPWLWRSLFWEAIKPVSNADLTLVDEGYYVVLAHGDVAGHPSGNKNIDAAYEMVTQKYGLAKTCSMSSMSRGTLSLFRWATENPEKVNSIYVDNGVCNVLSWPAGKLVPGNTSIANGEPASWADFKKKFGYSTDEEALKTKESPIDLLEPLAKAGVPILMVCGNKDHAVPYEENDAIMEKRYKALGGDIQVIVEDKGHSHGMKDPAPVLGFIRAHSGVGAGGKNSSLPFSQSSCLAFLMSEGQ